MMSRGTLLKAVLLLGSFAFGVGVSMGVVMPALQPGAGSGGARGGEAQVLKPVGANVPAECSAAASAVAELPDDVDLVVVVEHGADLRSSPLGDAATKFLAESGVLDDLTKAWIALSVQLGWNKEETFDRLLGQRVVLISSRVGGAMERRWAVLSDVTVETEERLKSRLQAAPRAIDQGHQILTLENGEYELTSHHRGPQAAGKQGKGAMRPNASDRVTVVLGPSGKSELFDEMVGILSRGGPAGAGAARGSVGLSTHDVFRQACQAGPAEVLVLAAIEPETADASAPGVKPLPAEAWKDFFLLAGHREPNAAPNIAENPQGSTWHSRVVVRQSARAESLRKIEPSSDAAFRALSSGSILAMMQNAPLPDVLGSYAPLTTMLAGLPLPESAKKQMSDRQAICIRAPEPDRRVCCTVAMRTNQTELLARTLDGEIARAVQTMEQRFGAVAPAPMDYSGVAPNAVRVAPIAASAEGGLSLLTSRPLVVAWAYPSQVAVNGPGNMNDQVARQLGNAAACGVNGCRPGWWVMSVCQTDTPPKPVAQGCAVDPAPQPAPAAAACKATPGEMLRGEANALLSEDPKGEIARWVWLVQARPAAMEGLLPSIIPDYNGLRSGLRRFESVDLRLQITEAGDIQGDLALRLAPIAR